MTGQESDDWRDALDAALRAGEQPLDALARILAQGQGAANTPPAGLTAAAGTRAGPWLLVRLLGMGGMGVTWQGNGPAGEVAAVKLTEVVTPGRRERFEAECQALLRLDHPRIVRYRGHGLTERSEGWLAMDLVVGQPLHEILDEVAGERPTGAIARALLAEAEAAEPLRSQPWQRRMLRMVLAVTEGVAAAHAQGIVHRDLKPANILLATDLEPVLIDFGLSRNLFRAVSLTRSGDVLGTLAYMAPEQLASDGEQVDARSDVYALGLLLYRLLVGRDLRDTPQSLLRARPRPFRLDPVAARQLSVPVQAILYRCLERDPKHRYAHAGELADDLRAVLGSGRVRARRPNSIALWSRSRAAIPTSLASAAAVMAGAAWLGWPEEGYWLTVDGHVDPVLGVQIDRGEWHSMPIRQPIAVSLGWHTLRIADATIRGPITRRISIDARRHRYHVPFLTVGNDGHRWEPREVRPLPGARHATGESAFLLVTPEPEWIELSVNGTVLPPDSGWWEAPAARCALVARSALGEERQEIELRPWEANVVQLLGGGSPIARVPGSYRRTVATLLSPMPPDVHLDREDGVEVFLNTKRDEELAPQMQAKCVLTPLTPGRTLRGSLRVVFPTRMRSLVFMFQGNVNHGRAPDTGKPPAIDNSLRFEWRVEGESWQVIPPCAEGLVPPANGASELPREHWYDPVEVPDLPAPGTFWLEVRATMFATEPPSDYANVEAFLGVADPFLSPGARPRPCFAVVADPNPQVSRLPK